MEYRQLGASGLKVPALSFGAGTFGGRGPLFGAWGNTESDEARRMVDICLDAGVTLFDTADVYSDGASEEVLGKAIRGKRQQLMISTKTTLPMGDGPNDAGSSRERLIRSCEASLRRLNTDHIDLYYLHAFDARTPVEEVLSTLDLLGCRRSGGHRCGNPQDCAPDRHKLATAKAHSRHGGHGCTQRIAASAKPGRSRMEPDPGANSTA